MSDTADVGLVSDDAGTVIKPKSCLQCGKMFQPSHKHNWMCRKCKNKNSSSNWDTWGGKVMYDTQ